MPTLKDAKALTITFLTPVSIGSLNGSDKEADNVSSIKKLTRGTKTYPYVSSQALRRALRDQLGVLNYELSEGKAAKEKKGMPSLNACPRTSSTTICSVSWTRPKGEHTNAPAPSAWPHF